MSMYCTMKIIQPQTLIIMTLRRLFSLLTLMTLLKRYLPCPHVQYSRDLAEQITETLRRIILHHSSNQPNLL